MRKLPRPRRSPDDRESNKLCSDGEGDNSTTVVVQGRVKNITVRCRDPAKAAEWEEEMFVFLDLEREEGRRPGP